MKIHEHQDAPGHTPAPSSATDTPDERRLADACRDFAACGFRPEEVLFTAEALAERGIDADAQARLAEAGCLKRIAVTTGEAPGVYVRVHAGRLSRTSDGDVPSWDAEARELTFRGEVVRRFANPAKSQAALLAAFEGEGWPRSVANPFPDGEDTPARDRLHSAIVRLNEGLSGGLIFHGDGTGDRATWEPSAPALHQPCTSPALAGSRIDDQMAAPPGESPGG